MTHDVECALDKCLAWMRGGTPADACLACYPEYANELRPLLQTVTQIGRVLTPPASRTARAEGQKRMLDALDKRRQQRAQMGAVGYALRRTFAVLFLAPAAPRLGRRPLWQSALVSLIVLIVVGTGLALAASGYSLPGEALYPVKVARQELQLALTMDPAGRASLQRKFEAQRRQDIGLALAAGNQGEVHFVGTLEDVQGEGWMVGGLRIRVSEQTPVNGEPEVGVQVRVRGRLPGDGSLQAIELRVFGAEIDDGPAASAGLRTPGGRPVLV